PLDGTAMGRVVREKRSIMLADLALDQGKDTQELYQRGIRSMILTPLYVSGEAVGTINCGSRQEDGFSPTESDLLLNISSIISSTVENRRLFDEIERRSAQLHSSAEVSRSASGILETDELFQQVVESIRDGFNLYYAGLFLVDETGIWTGEANKWAVLRAGTGTAGEQMLAAGHKLEIGGTSMIGDAISNEQARIALDVGEEAVFFRNPYLPKTRSEMALPLISRGRAVGALTIQSEQEAAYTQEDITALQTMADQVANAIENANLFEQTQERAEELAVLNEMARAFTQALDVDSVIENSYQYSARLMDANNFYLALYDSEEDTVSFRLFVIDGVPRQPEEPIIKSGSGITEYIIHSREPLLIEENVGDWLASAGINVRGVQAKSWLGVPMLRGNDVIGVIAVQSYSTPRQYNPRHLDLLSAVANQAAIAIQNARLFQETQARARREQILRHITAQVHSSADAESILRTAVTEVSSALGRQAFIQLGSTQMPESGDRVVNNDPPTIEQPLTEPSDLPNPIE
ncbi:MAG: GAF domain-containing protein, partial [Anaerolineae bacterium]|nr:GAF domain-containing protein [Anaerolineae bacterium]